MELKPGDEFECKGIIIDDDGNTRPSGRSIIFKYTPSEKQPEKKDLFTKVTRDEYLAFIASYPRPLVFDCTGICEPPLGSYNDFELSPKWPMSIVAKESRDWMDGCGNTDNSFPGKYWRYSIRTDLLKKVE